MRRTTRWIIAGCYYSSQFLGILAFSYDQLTGKVYTNRIVSAYCAIMSVALFGVIVLTLDIDLNIHNFMAQDLNEKIRKAIFAIRGIALLVTIIINWTKRKQFMSALNNFQNLREKFLQRWPMSPEVEQQYEQDVRLKFIWGLLSNILLWLECFGIVRAKFNWSYSFMVVMDFMAFVLCIVMTNYYIVVANVNVLLSVINEEVKKILLLYQGLSNRQYLLQISPNALEGQYWKLSNDLDALAGAQYKLRNFLKDINDIYDIQGVSVLLTVYMNNVAVLYIIYMLMRDKFTAMSGGGVASYLVPLFLFFYYVDLLTFEYTLLKPTCLSMEIADVLKNREPNLPIQNESLEESFKNFSLQLAKFPIEMKLVGLFQFDRTMAFSIFGSTISNAIVLIQYDYKNNYNE